MMTFEERIERLECILQTLEDGNASLDEVTKLFEEGVKISKSCYDMLESSKGKITILTEELQKMVEKPFEVSK